MQPMKHSRHRGQVFALEGIIAALVIVGALVLGLQAVDTAPWNDEERERGGDLRTELDDTLALAEDRGALREAVTTVDRDGNPRPVVPGADTQIAFDRILDNTTAVRSDLRVEYDYHSEGEIETVAVRDEPPSLENPTATATRQVVLLNNDTVRSGPEGEREEGTLLEVEDHIYLDNQAPDDELFTVVTVRVIAW